ncbi:hypothetical protein [Nocardia brasiliensis]
MSILIADHLTLDLVRLFEPSERERAEGQCFLLVTTDPDNSPRPCLLSVGEILVTGVDRLRIVVWPNSRTTDNLNRASPVLLTCAIPPDIFHITALPQPLPLVPAAQLARFELTVSRVERDVHEGLPVTQPMWFAATTGREESLLEMWRDQLALLGR